MLKTLSAGLLATLLFTGALPMQTVLAVVAGRAIQRRGCLGAAAATPVPTGLVLKHELRECWFKLKSSRASDSWQAEVWRLTQRAHRSCMPFATLSTSCPRCPHSHVFLLQVLMPAAQTSAAATGTAITPTDAYALHSPARRGASALHGLALTAACARARMQQATTT